MFVSIRDKLEFVVVNKPITCVPYFKYGYDFTNNYLAQRKQDNYRQ